MHLWCRMTCGGLCVCASDLWCRDLDSEVHAEVLLASGESELSARAVHVSRRLLFSLLGIWHTWRLRIADLCLDDTGLLKVQILSHILSI